MQKDIAVLCRIIGENIVRDIAFDLLNQKGSVNVRDIVKLIVPSFKGEIIRYSEKYNVTLTSQISEFMNKEE